MDNQSTIYCIEKAKGSIENLASYYSNSQAQKKIRSLIMNIPWHDFNENRSHVTQQHASILPFVTFNKIS